MSDDRAKTPQIREGDAAPDNPATGVTRRQALAGAGTALAAIPVAKLLGVDIASAQSGHDHNAHRAPQVSPSQARGHAEGHDSFTNSGHGIHGAGAPVSAKANALDNLLYPPPAKRYKPGRKVSYELLAEENDIEVAKGVTYPAWTFNGTVPGPIIRATEGDILSVKFLNGSKHPHTIHFHGIHPANMDGVLEIVDPGKEFLYEFEARPAGVHPYHCHVPPLREHIARGLYGTMIIDPKEGRKPAQELVMLMNGFDTDFDGVNNFYTVNGIAFFHAKHAIKVKRSKTVRIYLNNMTEFDPLNSFHLHGEFFRYQESGNQNNAWRHTDNVALTQGERGVIEIDFTHPGKYMFHAHQTEFIELGWTGFFEVLDQ
ncbi:MAG TPA: multicopper oxidase domain-containing protein [Solirubrobacterales bacterium]|jgi:FtsP/CotA-like multicopper oxidase with cupredoxin domain|nr:multicopper oxidase domain-containing protein [Solirubrobacterales bacterium]